MSKCILQKGKKVQHDDLFLTNCYIVAWKIKNAVDLDPSPLQIMQNFFRKSCPSLWAGQVSSPNVLWFNRYTLKCTLTLVLMCSSRQIFEVDGMVWNTV